MNKPSPHEVTRLLQAWSDGNQEALDKLVPLVYEELHRLARHYMTRERPGHTLQTSALVNEAYMRLVDWKDVRWQNRAHFFGVAAQMMRRILVDFARSRKYVKRGGEARLVSISEVAVVAPARSEELIEYDRAIEDYSTAVQRSPKNPHFQFLLGEAYLANGKYDKSITALRRAVALDPSPERWDRFPVLAHVLAVSGDRKEALKILSEQTRLAKQRYISPYNFAIISIGLGDKDEAFRYLNKAIDEGTPLKQVADRPLFDSIRSDRRYPELLRRIAETM